jgi:hypothetical protein
MRSKLLVCAAIAGVGVCTWFLSVAHAADSKNKGADKKKPSELHADDKSMKKQLQWESDVMGPDSKRAELDKIARANAINEKAAKDREKQAALEAAAPAPKAPNAAAANASKKAEVAIPSTPAENKLNDSGKNGSHEVSPKLASEAAHAPVAPVKPADDKFIDKLLKEEQPSSRKKSSASDRELDALLAGAKEKPAGRKNKGDSVDALIKSADKGPAMPAPRAAAALPEWTKTPDIAPSAPPPPPAPVVAKVAPKSDGVIRVVQGAVAPTSPAAAPIASRGTSGRKTAGASKTTLGKPTKTPVVWNDPFADNKLPDSKKTVASRDRETFAAPAVKKEPAAAHASASTGSAWNDPFADAPEPRRTTRRTSAAPAPSSPSSTSSTSSAPKRGEKGGDPNAHPAGWKDPFTKAPAAEPARAPVAMRELGKGESSKWEIAARHSPSHAPVSDSHVGGWGVLKKRSR